MKLKNLNYVALLAFVLCLVIPTVALAIPVKVTGVKPGQAVSVSGNNVMAGVYNLKVGKEKMDSFCIDFFQWAPMKTQKGYDMVALDSVFSDAVVSDLSKLWGNYYSADMKKRDAAGLQLAIWEVTADKGHNIYKGKINAKNSRAVRRAQQMLDSLDNISVPQNMSLYALTHGKKQDYMVGAPVPEPATMLLMGTGLLGAAAVRRKRKR